MVIAKIDRRHIYDLHIGQGIEPRNIHALLFFAQLNFQYFRKLCFKLGSDQQFASHFLAGPYFSPGWPRELTGVERRLIVKIACNSKSIKLNKLRTAFVMHFYGVVDGQTKSVSTIYRTLKRAQLSRKTMTRIHVLRCNVEGFNFFNRIAPNDPINCVVVDGMAASPQAFYEKLGWAPIGEECSQQQIVIGTRQFSVLAAVSPIGFLC